jgi:hypothetical protein
MTEEVECGLEELYQTPMTTMADRFTIDCSFCGFLTSARSLKDALEIANNLKTRHSNAGEKITVFDRLAQRGICNTWDNEGNCLHRK